ncbi:hypothetical protein GGS20DRAFT_355607 [Poronia punctata]|nr:hypothetical protein GGS20DRAFT_355607 [Poronia punctata]
MRGRPVDQLVYEQMFPKPRANDAPSFQALLHRHLILEVRQEVQSFYGHLDTQEAKYPGLDYCHPTHRIRLSRWPWHRRLFRALDALGLTDAEIAGLTKWEGTKWAKERFERDSGIVIKDTALEEVPLWVEHEVEPRPIDTPKVASQSSQKTASNESRETEEESEGELESVGFALNERLRERAARNEAGLPSGHYEEEWEQWLKNAIDSGEFPYSADPNQQLTDAILIPQALFPPNMLNAARAGLWEGIPDWVQDVLRRIVASETAVGSEQGFGSSTSGTRSTEHALERLAHLRRYSDLRSSTRDRQPAFRSEQGPSSSTSPTLERALGLARWHRYTDLNLQSSSSRDRQTVAHIRRTAQPGA